LNPARGTPPTLEWVALDRLEVDEAYQRSVEDPRSQKLIAAIARDFDWSLCLPLSCVRREGGQIMVVDGQHRLTGARMRSDIAHLPCVITSAPTVQDEAALFAKLNRHRRPLSGFEIWRAALAGGDADATAANAIIEAAGLKLAAHTNYSSWKPGQVGCIAGVVRAMKNYGPKPTERALIAIAEAYEGEVLNYAATLLQSLVPIYGSPPANFDPDAMIAGLQEKMQEEWKTAAVEDARRQLRPPRDVMTDHFLHAHNRHAGKAA
jgi:hypothetical protein